ncbi:hypothetical protein N2152v2_009783 [Parachlorella kessleri]
MQMAAREKVRAAVEEALGLDLGLLVEFTGLISWRPGACIDFHHDANRYYLQQRHYSAVTYLNTAEADFGGGAFLFQHGCPSQVAPMPGRVVAYSAQDVHGVQAVAGYGERFTLALWFTTDPQHTEDPKLLSQLGELGCRPLGLPAAMYQLPGGAADLRLCRLAMMGFALLPAPASRGCLAPSSSKQEEDDTQDSLQDSDMPVQLVVNLPRLAAWQGQETACVEEGRAPPVVDVGIEFPRLQQAVLTLQHWAWQHQRHRWSREDVCCQHLFEEKPSRGSSVDCSWLARLSEQQHNQLQDQQQIRGCVSTVAPDATEHGVVAALRRELQQASGAVDEYLGQLRQQLREVLPQWERLGAIF